MGEKIGSRLPVQNSQAPHITLSVLLCINRSSLFKTTKTVVVNTLYYQNGIMSTGFDIIMTIILGQRLKELREERNLTQKQIAEIFNINAVTYLHYEKNQREPPLSLLADFAIFFEVSTDYLLGLQS